MLGVQEELSTACFLSLLVLPGYVLHSLRDDMNVSTPDDTVYDSLNFLQLPSCGFQPYTVLIPPLKSSD